MSIAVKPATAKPIPFLDLVAQHAPLEEEILDVVRRAVRSAAFVGGAELTAFEREFATFVGAGEAAGVCSGTDALRFAYMALGVQPGDEIITVPHTFMATTEAITQAGGVVKFVDIDPDTMTMDSTQVAAAITDRTVGIVPVHLYGQPANMDPILALAKRHGLWVVEDAAQAHGALYKGRPCGSIGDLAAFSFYPGKNLGALGEGGATTGQDAKLLEAVRRLREHGQIRKYYHDSEGYNGRLDAIQAGFLRLKLRRLPTWNEGRRRAAGLYREALGDIEEIRLPIEAPYAHHVYHLFVVRTARRDALQAHLTSHGIGTGLHYPLPLHLQKAYENRGWRRGDFPVTEETAETLLSLPMFAELTESQIEIVADAVRAFFGA